MGLGKYLGLLGGGLGGFATGAFGNQGINPLLMLGGLSGLGLGGMGGQPNQDEEGSPVDPTQSQGVMGFPSVPMGGQMNSPLANFLGRLSGRY